MELNTMNNICGQINLRFQRAEFIFDINPRLRFTCHWAEIIWAFSPQNIKE